MDLWSKLKDRLKENPWWGALGILLTLIFGILTIILYFKGLHTKEPVYSIQSTNLIQDFTSRFKALKVEYGDERISNFTATKVAFWNNGKATINSGDIAPANPLMIKVKDGYKILDSSVLHSKEVSNQFKIIPSKDGLHVLIQFDYLDKCEGGVIQLLHTGKSSDDVEVCGTVKGVGKPKRHFPLEYERIKYRWYWWLLVIFVFFCPIVFLCFSLYIGTKLKEPIQKWYLVLLIIMFIIYWGPLVYAVYREHVPKGFEIFYEEFSNSLK